MNSPSAKGRVRSVTSLAYSYAANRVRKMPKHIGTPRERELYQLGLAAGYEAGVKYGRRVP